MAAPEGRATVAEVQAWLTEKKLADCVQLFSDNAIDGAQFATLNRQRLAELGVSNVASINKILLAVNKLKESFACPQCSNQFPSQLLLASHQQTVHGGVAPPKPVAKAPVPSYMKATASVVAHAQPPSSGVTATPAVKVPSSRPVSAPTRPPVGAPLPNPASPSKPLVSSSRLALAPRPSVAPPPPAGRGELPSGAAVRPQEPSVPTSLLTRENSGSSVSSASSKPLPTSLPSPRATPLNVAHTPAVAPTTKRKPTTNPFTVGARVQVTSLSGQPAGVVRYYGVTEFGRGLWVGIELDTPQGEHGGLVKGVRYFSCKPLRGIFVPPEQVVVASTPIDLEDEVDKQGLKPVPRRSPSPSPSTSSLVSSSVPTPSIDTRPSSASISSPSSCARVTPIVNPPARPTSLSVSSPQARAASPSISGAPSVAVSSHSLSSHSLPAPSTSLASSSSCSVSLPSTSSCPSSVSTSTSPSSASSSLSKADQLRNAFLQEKQSREKLEEQQKRQQAEQALARDRQAREMREAEKLEKLEAENRVKQGQEGQKLNNPGLSERELVKQSERLELEKIAKAEKERKEQVRTQTTVPFDKKLNESNNNQDWAKTQRIDRAKLEKEQEQANVLLQHDKTSIAERELKERTAKLARERAERDQTEVKAMTERMQKLRLDKEAREKAAKELLVVANSMSNNDKREKTPRDIAEQERVARVAEKRKEDEEAKLDKEKRESDRQLVQKPAVEKDEETEQVAERARTLLLLQQFENAQKERREKERIEREQQKQERLAREAEEQQQKLAEEKRKQDKLDADEQERKERDRVFQEKMTARLGLNWQLQSSLSLASSSSLSTSPSTTSALSTISRSPPTHTVQVASAASLLVVASSSLEDPMERDDEPDPRRFNSYNTPPERLDGVHRRVSVTPVKREEVKAQEPVVTRAVYRDALCDLLPSFSLDLCLLIARLTQYDVVSFRSQVAMILYDPGEDTVEDINLGRVLQILINDLPPIPGAPTAQCPTPEEEPEPTEDPPEPSVQTDPEPMQATRDRENSFED